MLTGTPVQLTPDLPGDYIVQMYATDPGGLTSVDTLLLTAGNTAPTVDAGADRQVPTGSPLSLDAVAADADGGASPMTGRSSQPPPVRTRTSATPPSRLPISRRTRRASTSCRSSSAMR
jgi:hypothetical protein